MKVLNYENEAYEIKKDTYYVDEDGYGYDAEAVLSIKKDGMCHIKKYEYYNPHTGDFHEANENEKKWSKERVSTVFQVDVSGMLTYRNYMKYLKSLEK